MDRTTLTGIALLLGGLAGYGLGIVVAYPGRAFSLTAVMIGVGLAAIGGSNGGESA